jgi:hypothetical protein
MKNRVEESARRDQIASSEMAGVTEWSPGRNGDLREFKIPHKLGRRPKGFWLASGPVQIQLVSTEAQKKRWDSTYLYAYLTTPYGLWGQVPGTIASGQVLDKIDIDRDLPFPNTEIYFGFAPRANQGNPGGEYPLRCFLYETGAPSAAAPHDQFWVSTMGAAAVAADLDFLMSVWVLVQASDKFVLQVY